MKIRHFIFTSFFYISIIFFIFFYIENSVYTFGIYNYQISLPLSVWILLVLCVFFLISLIFISLIVARYKFAESKLKGDLNRLINQIRMQIINNNHEFKILNPNLKTISNALKNFEFKFKDSMNGYIKTENLNFDKTLQIIQDISYGINVDLKKNDLNESSIYFAQNIKNSLNSNPSHLVAFNVIKDGINLPISLDSENLINEIYFLAWKEILKNPNTLNKVLKLPNIHCNYQIVELIVESKDVFLSQSDMLYIFKSAALDEVQYLHIAINLFKKIDIENIDFWLSIFEKLSKEDSLSIYSYFYILLDIGKISEAVDLKSHFPKDDYLPVSLFIELKNKGYPLLVFFDPLLYRKQKLENTKQTSQVIEYGN